VALNIKIPHIAAHLRSEHNPNVRALILVIFNTAMNDTSLIHCLARRGCVAEKLIEINQF
jgi:hypothetical protein